MRTGRPTRDGNDCLGANMIVLVACAGGPGDTDKLDGTSTPVDTSPADDSGYSATPPVLEGFEVCADGLDNDGDGSVDEADCAEAWMAGDAEAWRLGSDLFAARGDPSLVLTVRQVEGRSEICRVSALGDALQLSWCIQGYAGAAAVVGDETWLGVVRDDTDTGEVDRIVIATVDERGGVEQVTLTCPSCDLLGYPGIDLDPSGALLVPGGPDDVYLLADAMVEKATIEERATLHLVGDEDSRFGDAVQFLPDPGGDGIPEIVVGMPGSYPYYESSGVYIFDGLSAGSLTPEDADAAVLSDAEGYAYIVKRAGDVDGDGHSDLMVSKNDAMFLWLGPFIGLSEPRDVYLAGADRIAGDLSFWGDEATELAFGDEEYGIRVFGGPRSADTLDEGDADLAFDMPYHDALLFGDPDGDGTIELIVGDSGYGDPDTDDRSPGMVAVYDLSAL